jgi:transposase
MQRKVYTEEYKKEIIRLVTESGKRVTDVAKDVGIAEVSLRRWIKQYKEHGENAFPGKGHLRPDDEEMRKIKKKLADLEEENEILKKAMRIFTKPEK